MGKYGGLYGGAFLKATDLKNEYTPVTIASVGPKPVRQNDGQEKPMVVVGFRGTDKELVLNVTNYNTLCDLLGGDNEDGWVGHKINLWKTRTDYQGKMVDCIRITPDGQVAPPPEPVQQDNAPDFGGAPPHEDDEIPF